MSLHFIRHGESVSNEQNVFAGRVDTPLTELGRRQARQARQRIETAGLIFDDVHVSPLGRARETADVVVAGQTGVKTFIAEELIERDFGKLSEQNKSLIKKYFGATLFESMFHSAGGAPPEGESFIAMYARVKRYYDDVLKPASDSGRRVLVVSHKYTIEMFVLIAAELPPTSYHDFKIPNSKPCSLDDLRQAVHQTSAKLNTVTESIEAGLSKWILIAVVLGTGLRIVSGAAMPSMVYGGLMALLLSFNAFMSFLRLETNVVTGAPASLKMIWKGGLLKAIAGAALVLTSQTSFATGLGLFLLLPSAMTAPTFSLMWGGDYFLSVQATLMLSILSPLVIGLLGRFGHLTCNLQTHGFYVLLAVSVVLPGVIAQAWRTRRPIDAGALSTNWGWLGGASMIPLAALSTYQLMPSVAHFAIDGTGVAWIRAGLGATALFVSIRVFGLLAAKMSNGSARVRRDLYITHVVPNIFFWFELLPRTAAFDQLKMVAISGFFVSIYLEEKRFVAQFPSLANIATGPGLTRSYLVGTSVGRIRVT